jgi:predicted PurR-regulated permease PerM
MAAAEAFVAVLVGLVVAFFGLKDGDRLAAFVRRLLPERRRALASRLGERAWRTVGGFLRGAATLGAIEGTIVGVALAVVGADLAVPVAVLTFLAAFVPFVGAIIAGVVATLVALADAGTTAALIVAAVMLVVQQIDNEVLAPWVYGRMLSLHPVVVLLAVATGGALFGLAGTFLAVPVTAVAINVVVELRRDGVTPVSAVPAAPSRPRDSLVARDTDRNHSAATNS